MPSSKDKPASCDPKTATSRVRGPNRRSESGEQEEKLQTSSSVHFDEKGNPVLEIRSAVQRRRKDDNTIDLLKCLDDESLSLADDDN